jgi:hypothetical protein
MGDEIRTYRFGALERSGFVGGLRKGQLLLLGACAAIAFCGFLALGARHASVAIALALLCFAVGVVGAFVPIAGQPAADWAPIALRFLAGGRAEREWRSELTGRGSTSTRLRAVAQEALALPPDLGDVELMCLPAAGAEIGVLGDRGSGTYSATLAVRVAAFGLLDRADQERRLERWGTVLASLAREGGPVSRIQWIERSLPADGDEIGRYLAEARDQAVPLSSRSIRSYVELVDSAGIVTQDHELFITLQIDRRRAARAIKRLGGGEEGACRVLYRELELLAERLQAAQIAVRGALTPRALCKVLRLAFDPYCRVSLARGAAAEDANDGIAPRAAGPVAASEQWSHYRSDGALHATYWIAAWPRVEVPAVWLMPLLTQAGVLRSVAVTMEPIAPSRAIREAEAARSADIEEEQLRREHGFLTRARTRRRQEANVRREAELSRGHAELRFAGFITVSARTEQELELACERTEHGAACSHLELRRLYGAQARAFCNTLPLARGLR